MDKFVTTQKVSNLTDDQNVAFDAFKEGKNLLITGPAGTGKSHLIRKMSAYAQRIKKTMAITAMTGAAAYIVNGKTLHSWAGIGLGDKPAPIIAQKILNSYPKKIKWQRCNILIIDEVSMMNALLFELLEEVARLVRQNEKPFGGIQVVLLGDFYQLPPVGKTEQEQKFCFESPVWINVIEKTVILREIMRQKDPVFQKILQEVRIGEPSLETIEILMSRVGIEPDISSGIVPTLLSSKKLDVEKMNQREFRKLAGLDIIQYDAVYEIVGERKKAMKEEEMKIWIDVIDKDNNYEKSIQITENAQVMLLKNIDQENGLVNGSRGIVIGFENDLPVVRFMNGTTQTIGYAEYSFEISNVSTIVAKQIPLSLAWCTTIHKSQGQSLDSIKMNIGSNIFEYGQTYVALSRARTLENLYIEEFDPKKIRVHPKVKELF